MKPDGFGGFFTLFFRGFSQFKLPGSNFANFLKDSAFPNVLATDVCSLLSRGCGAFCQPRFRNGVRVISGEKRGWVGSGLVLMQYFEQTHDL